MQRTIIQLCLSLVFVSFQALAAETETGPVIANFGPVYAVPEGSFNLDPKRPYKILMDIGKGPDDPSALNQNIETAARILNMHARNGIKPENLKIAMVLHGSGIHSALNDPSYSDRFVVPNSNKELIAALLNAGVDIYVCGQSAAYNGYTLEDLLPGIKMAVSAITVHVRLQQDGYQAILF